jgi:hypothetical protein
MGSQQPLVEQMVFPGHDALFPPGQGVTPAGQDDMPVPAQKIAHASPESPPLF